LTAGRPVVFTEGLPTEVSESTTLSEVRSALYAPIYVRGRAAACLGVTHRRVGGLFQEAEERLAAFITVLAGAALENAAGFARLKETEAELRRSNQAKDQFLAMLAHELRNPLAPIVNALHLLRRSDVDDRKRLWAVDAITRQARHMTRIVDDLLDVSRISRGKIELARKRLDLVRLVRESAEDLRGTLESKQLELHLNLPTDAVWVDGDSTRLTQVLGNLLHNATKFTEPGG
jgi:signal transduction histidine kinase